MITFFVLPLSSRRLLPAFFLLFLWIPFAGAQTYFNNLENPADKPVWIGLQTVDSGAAKSGNFMSVTNPANPYGLGVEMSFPDAVRGKNTWMTVSGWVKSSSPGPNALYVVTVTKGGREYFWQGISLDTLVTEKEQWNYFSNTFKFPASVTGQSVVKSYLWNAGGVDTISLDDLSVEFREVSNPSYLPDLKAESVLPEEDGNTELLFMNPFYSVWLYGSSRQMVIAGKNGILLMQNMRSVDELTVDGNRFEQQAFFTYKGKKLKNGFVDLVLTAKSTYSIKRLTLSCKADSPEIQAEVTEKYRKNVLCHRSAIVMVSGQKVTEVFRKNRKRDTVPFQNEYWLAHEGVKFGKNRNSLVIYHVPQVSSLQLDAVSQLLVVNLDYEKDHPFLHFPLDNDTIDYKQDWSASLYKKREKRTNTWKMFAGTDTGEIPRLMKNPNGYLATYIWTEHADFTNIRSNRAAYFGSEKISRPEEATGGFIRYGIPVTKSVFYANPDETSNTEASGGLFNEPESAILTDTAFRGFLAQIQQHGVEICLHTPEQFTTTPARLNNALQFTHEQYNSVSWIDHGYNNHLENNREDLMCDGLLKKSPYYATGLWKKYGVKYYWNAYYEDYFTFAGWKFGSSIEPYYSGYGDFMPRPDYWRHPTRSGSFIHWPTSTVLYMNRDEMWEYFFNEDNLSDFVADWDVEMNHCYPAWVDPQKGFWAWNSDSVMVAQSGFNRTLERMARLRDEGKLHVTTVREFLDYQVLLENIIYRILPDGRIEITNLNEQDIQRLSFAIRASEVMVDGMKTQHKREGEDLIFWFDLGTLESKTIRVIE